MIFRPRSYTRMLSNVAVAVESERARRDLSYAAVGRLAGWDSRARQRDIAGFCRGDTTRLGYEAALRVAEALGLDVDMSVRAPGVPLRIAAAAQPLMACAA